MKHIKVVNLGQVRDLLAEWDRVKAHIVCGRITDFHAVFRDSGMNEAVFTGGVYREDPAEAARAVLRVSAYRTLTEDPPPRMTRAT